MNKIIREIKELFNIYIKYNTFTWDISKALEDSINGESKLVLSRRAGFSIIPYSFLTFKNSEEGNNLSIDFQILKEWFIEKSKIHKSENLLRLLVLIKSLPLPNQETHLLLNYFFQNLTENKKKNLAKLLFVKLNNMNFTYLEINLNEPKSITDWELLRKRLHFSDILHPALNILNELFFSPYKGLLWDSVNKLKSIFFAHSIAWGKNALLINQDEDIIREQLKTKPQKLRIAYLLKSLDTELSKNISESLVKYLIQNEWLECGRIVMQKVFGRVHNYDENIDFGVLERVTYNFLKEESIAPSILFGSFEWPKDWQAYAGFILKDQQLQGSLKNTGSKTFSALSKTLYEQWESTKPTQEYFTTHRNLLGIYEIMHPKNRLTMALAIDAILLGSSRQREKWTKWLNNFLHSIKPYFYSIGTQYQVKDTITEIILLHASCTCVPNLNKNFQKRIKINLELIQNIVLYPYINLMEEEEDIWNPRRIYTLKPFGDAKTYLMNSYLKDIFNKKKSDHFKAFEDFLNKWQEWANVEWYWFAQIEEADVK